MTNGPQAHQHFAGTLYWFIIFNLIFQAEESRRQKGPQTVLAPFAK